MSKSSKCLNVKAYNLAGRGAIRPLGESRIPLRNNGLMLPKVLRRNMIRGRRPIRGLRLGSLPSPMNQPAQRCLGVFALTRRNLLKCRNLRT